MVIQSKVAATLSPWKVGEGKEKLDAAKQGPLTLYANMSKETNRKVYSVTTDAYLSLHHG